MTTHNESEQSQPGITPRVRPTLDDECVEILKKVMNEEGLGTLSGTARVLIVRGYRGWIEDHADEVTSLF